MDYIKIIVIAFIALLLAKFILNLNIKRIIELIINILLGIAVLWLINKFGGSYGISIPINIITAIIVGILGLPGVIILLILSLLKII